MYHVLEAKEGMKKRKRRKEGRKEGRKERKGGKERKEKKEGEFPRRVEYLDKLVPKHIMFPPTTDPLRGRNPPFLSYRHRSERSEIDENL